MNKNALTNPAKPKIAFFGTPDFAVWVLDGLKEKGILPDLIVAAPDAPKGRRLVMTSPAAKVWAAENNIPVIQPEKIRGASEPAFIAELEALAGGAGWDLFIVAAYGKILPESVLYLPHRKTINVHPSLLPLLRGASPLQSAILNDMKGTGVTIMLLDKEMDHGPLLAQGKAETASWPIDHRALGKHLAREGAGLIAQILPSLLDGTAKATEQDHAAATYTEKISKEDGLIDLATDGYKNFLRYNAYKGWPGVYFFIEKGGKRTRVTITEAALENGAFSVKKVIPEGKKEMGWDDFQRSLR
jgi:methionyl-tRNA formyltransferase